MTVSDYRAIPGLAALLVPSVALAHAIPPVVVGLALSPVVALLLACVYGYLEGRWRVLVLHLLLISAWVVWFGIAANFATSDYIIWAPIAAIIAHIAILVLLITWKSIASRRA